MYLITNGRVLTFDNSNPYYEDGGVVVDGTKIVEVGDDLTLKLKYPHAEIIDAEGNLIMPAFINMHTHSYSAITRGFRPADFNPDNLYQVINGMWWNVDRNLDLESVRASAYASFIECIKNGVTTVFDHHASYGYVPASLFEIADAAKEIGIRSCLCYEVSDREGSTKRTQAIKENYDYIKHVKEEGDPMSKAMFGLHAPFTLSDKTIEKCIEANNGETGFHILVSEGIHDIEDTWDKYKKRPVERLNDLGILGSKTILSHCVNLSEEEMDIIKDTDTMVVCNPESNMYSAAGCAPTIDMYNRGILTGLGTDGYTADMLETLRVSVLSQRLKNKMPNIGWAESFGMLFKNNRRMCARYFDEPLGVLKAGAAADIIIMDYRPFTPFNAENADAHIIFGMSGRQCLTTVANGKILMRNRQLLTVDENAVNAKIAETAKKLWKNINTK